MSYLSVKHVQAWLQQSKYPLSSVDGYLETAAVTSLFGKLAVRYDTSSWTDESNTPEIVLTILSMKVASFELRKAAGEEDGLTSYADFLDKRVDHMCDGIVSGKVVLPDAYPIDTTSSLGSGPIFWPNDAATDLAETDPSNELAAALYFTMNRDF